MPQCFAANDPSISKITRRIRCRHDASRVFLRELEQPDTGRIRLHARVDRACSLGFSIMVRDRITARDQTESERGHEGDNGEKEHLERGQAEPARLDEIDYALDRKSVV